jgi:hypothetical protein
VLPVVLVAEAGIHKLADRALLIKVTQAAGEEEAILTAAAVVVEQAH